MEEFFIRSGWPFAGLTVDMAESELLITICSISFNGSQTVFVGLAGWFYQRNQQDEAEEEQKLVFITINGVHAIQWKRLTEALISHVEGANEAEFFQPTSKDLNWTIYVYPERWSGLWGVTLMLGTFYLTTRRFCVEKYLRLVNTCFNIFINILITIAIIIKFFNKTTHIKFISL